jgi:hypothetical protein
MRRHREHVLKRVVKAATDDPVGEAATGTRARLASARRADSARILLRGSGETVRFGLQGSVQTLGVHSEARFVGRRRGSAMLSPNRKVVLDRGHGVSPPRTAKPLLSTDPHE